MVYRLLNILIILVFSIPLRASEMDHTLRLNTGGEPETLDPTMMRGSVDFRVLTGLMEGLIRVDQEGHILPGSAETWSVGPKNKVWTFRIRKDGKWHNGDPLTAHDFVYAMKRICTPKLAAPYAAAVYGFLQGGKEYYEAGGLNSTADFAGVQALDDHTLRFNLVSPTPYFDTVVYLFSWYPVHRGTVEEHGQNWWMSPETFNGNGPFKMTYRRGYDRVEATKSSTYWDHDNIFWEKVIWRHIDNETTEHIAFKTGDLDITNAVPIPEIPSWSDKPEYHLYSFYGTYYITFNNADPPFNDVRVRRAFSQSINRKLLTERVTRRNEPISRGLIPASLSSVQGGTWADHVPDLIGPRLIESSKKLLADAGYPEGKDFPEIEYLYNTSEEHKNVAEFLQFQLKSVLSVDMRLRNVEWGQWLQDTRKGNFSIARMSWYGDYLDAMTFLELFTSDSTQNTALFSDEKYDDLIARARMEENAIEREKLLMEAEKYLIGEQCVIMPLFTYQFPILIKNNIENVYRNALGGLEYTRGRRVSQPE